MDVSKKGPNEFERTSLLDDFDFILDVEGMSFRPGTSRGRSVPTEFVYWPLQRVRPYKTCIKAKSTEQRNVYRL